MLGTIGAGEIWIIIIGLLLVVGFIYFAGYNHGKSKSNRRNGKNEM